MADLTTHRNRPEPDATESSTTAHSDALPGRPRVVAVAVVSARRERVIEKLSAVVQAGGSAVLITANGAPPLPAETGIECIDLLVSEGQVGVNRVVALTPRRSLGRLRARLHGAPAGRPRRPTSRAWQVWARSSFYRSIRPWMLWRALRRRLDDIDPKAVDHILVVALESWPITWQLCRLSPQATYGWDVPDEVYERVGRPAPEPITD